MIRIFIILTFLPLLAKSQAPKLVKDILHGAESSGPKHLVALNNRLYFTCTDSLHGNELWTSDGTDTGTFMVADIWPGNGSSDIAYIIAANGLLFFGANDSIHGHELWTSDGTGGGTQMVKEISEGQLSGYPYHFRKWGNKVTFLASDTLHGTERWVSDGTTIGSFMLKDIVPGPIPSMQDEHCVVSNGKLFFHAAFWEAGDELWVSDGTETGTRMVKDIFPLHRSSNPREFIDYNNKTIFWCEDDIFGHEVWESDGTATGTKIIRDICPDIMSAGGNQKPFIYKNSVFFSGFVDSTGSEFWKTDGTYTGTVLVSEINKARSGPFGSNGSHPSEYCIFQNLLYFQAFDTSYGFELWYTDGTEAGTKLFKDLVPGLLWAAPKHLVDYHGKLYFVGNETWRNQQLWVTDGNKDSTYVLSPDSSYLDNALLETNNLVVCNNKLFFNAHYDSSTGNELYYIETPVNNIVTNSLLNAFVVYPNPTTNNANLLIELKKANTLTITLTDIHGRIVFRIYNKQYGAMRHDIELSLGNQPAGTYTYSITDADGRMMAGGKLQKL